MKDEKFMHDLVCVVCLKSFQRKKLCLTCCRSCQSTYINNKRYANPENRKHYFYDKECVVCKKTYKAYSANKNTISCSRKCNSIWKKLTYTGRKLTPEWIANQNKAKQRENIVKYGDFFCKKCGAKFETNLSLRAHTSYCNNQLEQQNIKCEFCNKSFKRQRNLTVHIMLKHDNDRNIKHKETCVIGCQKRLTQRTSNEENEFFVTLQNLYGEVVHKFKINNVGHEYDYYVPSLNLIIEYDGDYWHGNPKTQILTQNMKKQFFIDKASTVYALTMGYKIHRVWSSESRNYPTVTREIKHVEYCSCQDSINQKVEQSETSL